MSTKIFIFSNIFRRKCIKNLIIFHYLKIFQCLFLVIAFVLFFVEKYKTDITLVNQPEHVKGL